ncbi:AAA family ATPase [Anaerobaca lacustris]|uniref:AAA family ATPase n=1 Tax=Anaerobaca lacustris TaxID=3044600 RepID=A0AAW6TWZ5_9BACT|nr:AAA family ATPase [Sedimentisphaerales bacterium M17dextr]
MLKRFRVNNFRSLLNVEFRPVGVNVLIGPNNAGKTNLCSALRFLGLSASLSLEDAIRASVGETWNIRNVYTPDKNIEIELECSLPYKGDTIDFEYSLSLAVRTAPSGYGHALSVWKETLRVTGVGFVQTPLLENSRGEVRSASEGWSGKPGLHPEGFALSHFTERLSIGTTAICQQHPASDGLARLFREYLHNWSYYAFSPYSLRSPVVVRESPVLSSDGKNLTRTYFSLHNEKPRTEKKLIEIIKTLEPRLDLFTYTSPDPDSVYLFMEDQKGNRFGVQSISDGTLRFMAMAYLILTGEDANHDSPPGLTIIEEPENGLYVGHLKPLFEKLTGPGRKDQFIFTTHSPYFIDLFDSCLDGVHLVKPGVPSSEIKKPDPEKTGKLLDEMPLGEMHFREMLG